MLELEIEISIINVDGGNCGITDGNHAGTKVKGYLGIEDGEDSERSVENILELWMENMLEHAWRVS